MTLELTKADDGTTVTARVHDTVRLTLAANRTTGFRWSIAVDDPAVLDVSGDDHAPRGEAPGAAGTTVFTLAARAPGTTRLRATLARAWERGAAPAESVAVTVVVES